MHMINVDDHILPHMALLHDGVHLLFIGGVYTNNIIDCFTMIIHQISFISEEYSNIIFIGSYPNLKWLLYGW